MGFNSAFKGLNHEHVNSGRKAFNTTQFILLYDTATLMTGMASRHAEVYTVNWPVEQKWVGDIS